MTLEPQPYIYASETGSDPGSSPPSWFVNHKSLLIKISAAVVVVLVVLVVVLFLVNRHQANLAWQQEQKQTAIKTVTTDCAEAKHQAACEALAQTALAKKQADLSYCAGLVGDDYDDCATAAAISSKDVDVCKKVANEKKQASCEQLVAIAVAKETNTYEACDLITDEDLHAGCQKRWISSRLLKGECVSPPMTERQCATANALKPAIEAKDLALCDLIIDENDQALCQEVVGALQPLAAVEVVDTTTDSDGDGLTDYDETNTWQTDPAKADSDGDGYDDGMEVKTGYNPLATGKL